MREKLAAYFKGLLFTAIAMVIFSAIGWIHVQATFAGARFLVPLALAAIAWTIMFFVGQLVWVILLLAGSYTMGIGFLVGLGVLGYAALRVAAYLLPGWMIFTEDQFLLFIIGATIALIDVVVNDERRMMLGEIEEE